MIWTFLTSFQAYLWLGALKHWTLVAETKAELVWICWVWFSVILRAVCKFSGARVHTAAFASSSAGWAHGPRAAAEAAAAATCNPNFQPILNVHLESRSSVNFCLPGHGLCCGRCSFRPVPPTDAADISSPRANTSTSFGPKYWHTARCQW